MTIYSLIKYYLVILLMSMSLLFYTSIQSKATEKYITVFKDHEIENYISKISTPLLKTIGINPQFINFYLIIDSQPNAFVANGQNIFICTGLLNMIQSDDELAGVISHEISHITEGHILQGTMLAQKSQKIILISLLLGTIAAALNPTYLGAVLATMILGPNITVQQAQLYYNRADEMQADMLAISILNKTQYSGYGLIHFLERIQKLEGNPNYYRSWYATHPETSTRIEYLRNYLKHSNKQEVHASNALQRIKIKLEAINLDYKTFINKYSANNDINLYGLSIAELKNSNYKKAEEIINTLIQKYPNDQYYLELLGDIYYSLNQFEKAYITYLKINNNTDFIIDLKIAKSAYSINTSNMLKESLKYVNISLGKNNASPLAWHLKSLALAKLNNTHLAILAIAQKYYYLGEFELANKYAKNAIQRISPNKIEWIEAQDLIQKTHNK